MYVKGNSKHGEIIKAEFDIFALSKTQGVNWWTTKAQRTNLVNDIQTKKYQSLTDERQYLSETER